MAKINKCYSIGLRGAYRNVRNIDSTTVVKLSFSLTHPIILLLFSNKNVRRTIQQ